jgi:exodeoxyribonuclease VIII
MQFGTAAHTAVLEPEKLVCAPKCDKRTKAGKEAADIFASLWEGKDVVIVDPDTYNTVRAIAESVRRHPVAARILAQGEAEMSAFGLVDDVRCKARPDWWSGVMRIVADLKTTNDASPAGVARSVANFRYHVQQPFYTDVMAAEGLAVDSFVFIFVEKTPPFLVGVYVLDTEAVEIGREEYQRDLAMYRECKETGIWPGLSERLELITLPRWAKTQTEEYWI